MGYSLNAVQAEAVLQALKQNYSVYAPKRFPKQGRYSDTDVIKYAEVEHYEDIVWQVKSDYPAKEVLTPIQQAIFYFTEDEYRASKGPKKPILILARPCDINAQHVQAKINKTDDYSLALKFSDEGVQVQVTDETFAPYFEGMPQAGYTPAFVEENELKVTVPDLDDKAVRLALKSHPMWKEFDGRCISCGACTVACSTCTCFTTRDVIYGDNPEVGERRRVTASCQIAGFDQMAGQREFRSTAGERMRYKVLHKFHDYKARFGEGHMCVGCGRCTHRCPELISISATVNKVNAAVNEIKAGLAQQ